jgi:type IV secretory pathway VirB3-like protein
MKIVLADGESRHGAFWRAAAFSFIKLASAAERSTATAVPGMSAG